MNNFSKNNYSDKNSNKYKKRSERNHYLHSSNFSDEKDPNEKNYNIERKISKNKNKFQKLNKKNKNINSFFSKKDYKTRNSANKFSENKTNKYQDLSIKKNFDDWIWGKHSVYEALNSERPINRIWCTQEIFSTEKFYILLKKFKSKGVLVEEVSWNRLSQLTFGASHQGISLQLASSDSISLSDLVDLSFNNSKNPIIVALDGITDPHNLGAIIRSAEAFNCKGIIIPQRRSVGLTGTVAKVAAGALEHIPVSRVVNLNRALDELKRSGFLTIGLTANGNTPLSNYNAKSPLVLIIGSEDKGISLITQKKCDFLFTIPLRGKTSSLNASVAAAISLFHITNK